MSVEKKKPGGKPTVPIEWREDTPFVIATEEFDYAYLDRPADFIIEALKAGKDIQPVISEIVAEREDAIRAETIVRTIEFIITSDNPSLETHAIALAGGLGVLLGLTGSDVAEKFGVSKQSVQQRVKRFCKAVGMRKTRAMRDDEAREKMSNSNYRPIGHTKGKDV